uniref:Secreted protein n=1 Tax=Cacopsylla melanoneura TaxID=428564 RepID=A0A8D8S1K2_9HEMI
MSARETSSHCLCCLLPTLFSTNVARRMCTRYTPGFNKRITTFSPNTKPSLLVSPILTHQSIMMIVTSLWRQEISFRCTFNPNSGTVWRPVSSLTAPITSSHSLRQSSTF